MAFVASEEDDDEEEKPEAEVDFNHDDVGKRIELIPNRDILIHKPQVRFAEKLWQYDTNAMSKCWNLFQNPAVSPPYHSDDALVVGAPLLPEAGVRQSDGHNRTQRRHRPPQDPERSN